MSELVAADKTYRDAHRAWNDELYRTYGDKGAGLRFTDKGKGKPGSPLNKAWVALSEAVGAYHRLQDDHVRNCDPIWSPTI